MSVEGAQVRAAVEDTPTRRLRKQLGLADVYAIATGATLSAGLFLLPGLAAAEAGPAVVLAYALAAVPLVPATFSIVELATAMPRAGGSYYFLDRSIGPLAGAVGGLGTWMALVLKTAFALVGMGAYLSIFLPGSPGLLVAAGFAVFFGVLNLYGSDRSGGFQRVLLGGLLAILAGFVLRGMPELHAAAFEGFFAAGFESIAATTGLVYISYVGVTKVASVSEEVRDPERNLPRGVFLALGTAVIIYVACNAIIVAVVPREVLAGHLTPVAEAAGRLGGDLGVRLVSLAALLAFASVANAGILAASRYPLAMSRDRLLPPVLSELSARSTPAPAVLLTVGTILVLLLLLDPLVIAKLASAFQLLMFGLLCLAVVIMRESGIESYDPGYRSPAYPWMQIAGMALPLWLIPQMGWLPALFSAGLVAAGIALYLGYGRGRVVRHGAVYHVFERLGRRRFDALDTELRGILKEKGLREQDPYEQVVARAPVLDHEDEPSFETLAGEAADHLALEVPYPAGQLAAGFLEGTRTGATPVAGGVALPHLRVPGLATPRLLLARCRQGVRITTRDALGDSHTSARIRAVFFLVSPDDDPGQHLRLLAHLASRVDEDDFLEAWVRADDVHALREILLRDERTCNLELLPGSAAARDLADQALRQLSLPEGSLVALVHREGEVLIPRGSTVLRLGDRVTVIGDPSAIDALRLRYGTAPALHRPG